MMAAKHSCVCGKVVGKTTKSLGCFACGVFFHLPCIDVDDNDFGIMSKKKHGFKWFCGVCDAAFNDFKSNIFSQQTLHKLVDSFKSEVSNALAKVSERLNVLEEKSTIPDASFAEIMKQTLEDSKREAAKNLTEVDDHGKKKTVRDSQVLVIKPKAGSDHASPPDTTIINTALASIPVENCSKTNSGALVVRLPTKDARVQAGNAINQCLGDNSNYTVSEPKKMQPKMTLTGISPCTKDDEIIPSILSKNPKIKSLVDDGFALSLIFTKQKTDAHTKMAVLRLSPEIRSFISDSGNYVYVGLSRCRAYDRFWVTQCYHCQSFGHVVDRCPVKNDSPCCCFCAGSHRAPDCSNRSTPKCINCVKSSSSLPSNHHASSKDCPFMIAQRNKIIENTNFTCSKN